VGRALLEATLLASFPFYSKLPMADPILKRCGEDPGLFSSQHALKRALQILTLIEGRREQANAREANSAVFAANSQRIQTVGVAGGGKSIRPLLTR